MMVSAMQMAKTRVEGVVLYPPEPAVVDLVGKYNTREG
jgi:hypothetical protein